MGVTTQELMKMMEQGQILANDFLPKFSKGLREAAREGGALTEGLKTSRVAMQRVGTAFSLNVLDAFDSGAERGLSKFFNSISDIVSRSGPIFRTLGTVFGFVAEAFGLLLSAGYQLIRPLGMLADLFFSTQTNAKGSEESIDGLTTSFSSLKYVLKTIASYIILPFAVLESVLDTIQEKIDNIRNGKSSIMDAGLDLAKEAGHYGAMFMGFGSNLVGLNAGGDAFFETARRLKESQSSNTTSVKNGDVNITVEGSSDPEATAREVEKVFQKEWDWKMQSATVGDY